MKKQRANRQKRQRGQMRRAARQDRMAAGPVRMAERSAPLGCLVGLFEVIGGLLSFGR